MIYLVLTGSIGAGKSTVLNIVEQAGYPALSADSIVHQLFETDQDLVGQIFNILPEAVVSNKVNIETLRSIWAHDNSLTFIQRMEELIHPKVYKKINQEINRQKPISPLFCVEIPLFFETFKNQTQKPDCVCVVHTSSRQQKKRALSKAGMTTERLTKIAHRQWPAHEKIKKADWVIYSYGNLTRLEQRVHYMLKYLLDKGGRTNA